MQVISKRDVSNPDDFVFYDKDKKTPVYYKAISESLYAALDHLGIKADQRKERKLTFHSWRHFFNTNMRMLIPDSQLRLLTGHQTEEMTDHYTQLSPEHFSNVKEKLEEAFGKRDAKKKGAQVSNQA